MAANLNKYSCLLGKAAGMQFCGAGFQSDKDLKLAELTTGMVKKEGPRLRELGPAARTRNHAT